MTLLQRLSAYAAPSFALFALLCLCPRSAAAQAPERTLWQIGQVDQDDKEFALAAGGRSDQYREDALYTVGLSKPATDWPYVQPGPADAWAGSRSHEADIYFAVAHPAAQGTCRLTLSFVDTQAPLPPQLEIRVNGQSWTRDTLPGSSDQSLVQPSKGKPSAVTVDFPAALLTAGVNQVSITTVRGSWMIYDAVTLSAPEEVTLGAAPTFIHLTSAEWLHDVLTGKDNALQQVLRIQTDNAGAAQEVTLRVTGETDRTITVSAGHSALEESYPESHAKTQTQVQLIVGGRLVPRAVTAERLPCRHYTIYCINHSHMDIGYAYLQAKTLELHRQYLEAGLKENAEAQASGLPSDDRFRWNLESLVEADDWLKKASPDQIALFEKEAQSGDLGLSGLYCNELTGICRPEELAALLACANRLRTQYHVPIDSAMISDVPGYTWGLVPILAQSGIKYFSWGPNPNDHLGSARDFDNQAYYWLSPSGKEKVLVWQSINGYQSAFNDNEDSLVNFLKDFDRRFPNDPYDMIYDRRTTQDNGPAEGGLPAFLHDWNSHYAYPHLVMATTSQMFHEFEAKYGKTLPTLRGDYTGYWEDGAASTANETAYNRNAAETMAQDDILWSLLSPAQYPHARFDDAWKSAVLYDEHTWGADQSWNNPESDFTKAQWQWKRQYALDARSQAQALQTDALKAVTAPGPSNTIAVFNTCSWPRTDLVILPADLSRAGDAVHDALGKAVPSQRLADGTLAFMAGDIPAMASRKFTVAAGKAHFAGSASAAEGWLQSRRMSLHFDPQTGAIVSWKANGIATNLVNSSDKTCRGLNDYLYVLGGDNGKVQGASDAKLTVVDKGPLVASIRVDSSAPGSNSLSRLVQVVDGLDQVRITDTFDKTQEHNEEAVHLGFNFNVPGSTARMDMPWAVVRPDVDQTIHANKTTYPVDRWADVSNTAFGVTCANLDAPMLQIGEITAPRENAGGWLQTAKTGSTLYWNVMNNYWHTNYKAYQPGDGDLSVYASGTRPLRPGRRPALRHRPEPAIAVCAREGRSARRADAFIVVQCSGAGHGLPPGRFGTRLAGAPV